VVWGSPSYWKIAKLDNRSRGYGKGEIGAKIITDAILQESLR
ncbi:unnamed protein product, partial [Acidithrix sp. C25]